MSISGFQVMIIAESMHVAIPPYFYYDEGYIQVGRQVEQAIDLYPFSIYHIYDENDRARLEAYAQTLQEFAHRMIGPKPYVIQLDAPQPALQRVLEDKLAGSSVKVQAPDSDTHAPKLPELRRHLVAALTNRLVRQYELDGVSHARIERMILLRIRHYTRDLLEKGHTCVAMKLVERGEVRAIRFEFGCEEVTTAAKVIELMKRSDASADDYTQMLYELYEDNYKVTFISPFSYGKSTLINGLLGEQLLKADIRAETAIITKVVSADAYRLFVKYDDGRIVMQSFETYMELSLKLQEFTGVRSEEAPVEVQIHHRSEAFRGLTVIDAPGLNSRHADHNQKANEALDMSDLVLFLKSPSHIGESHFTKQMEEFLQFIRGRNKRYGYVLSKLDMFSDDYELIMNEMEIVLKQIDPDYKMDQVFFVSGYFALYGKLLRDDKIELDQVRRKKEIFALEGDDIYAGRSLEMHHCQALIGFSQIEQLETFILARGRMNHAADELRLDRREPAAAGVAEHA
ncbi:hypothetical protein D3P08_06175 [Paenibacillus nanensis]|uniref:Dynamin N-terminal domain-containing protein n=1 Tax=Paenibacillus nanensis TaxID=393251 RepID=A0A3A1VQE8_9BACL|nr:dynamin family protein [Paenibacillus nanensis]RIX59710.1 hypothetical protein D3P08_06175 [Paenibacillus nanensis]